MPLGDTRKGFRGKERKIIDGELPSPLTADIMGSIYTTYVAQSPLDESPMAYKGLDAILSQIGPTAEVVKQIRPVYYFKAGT